MTGFTLATTLANAEEGDNAVAGEKQGGLMCEEEDGLVYENCHRADDEAAPSSLFNPAVPCSAYVESERSGVSTVSFLTSSSFYPSSVHGNLMRANPGHRDPMRYYQIIKVLGEGSMGSVAKVKRRDRAKGGSARSQFVEEERDFVGACFCAPFLAPFVNKVRATFSSERNPFLILVESADEISPLANDFSIESSLYTADAVGDSSKYSSEASALSRESGRFCMTCTNGTGSKRRKSKLQDAWPSTSTLITHGTKRESYYALKSIHLDRCTNRAYMKELRNEGTREALVASVLSKERCSI
jgi:hypothetical protein